LTCVYAIIQASFEQPSVSNFSIIGQFSFVFKVSPIDYNRGREKVFHVNMLKL
jgi:hypothetical protein